MVVSAAAFCLPRCRYGTLSSLWLSIDDFQKCSRWTGGNPSALFPVLERADVDAKGLGKYALTHVQSRADQAGVDLVG